jgi:hypothetical protein
MDLKQCIGDSYSIICLEEEEEEESECKGIVLDSLILTVRKIIESYDNQKRC